MSKDVQIQTTEAPTYLAGVVTIDDMPGYRASRAGIPVDVAIAMGRAIETYCALRRHCPHDIGLVAADALAPFWRSA